MTGELKITIPAGAILAVSTIRDGSIITNLRKGIFSTSSTTITLARGTTFMILVVDSTGLFYVQSVMLVTRKVSQVTVPVQFTIGSLMFTNEYRITSIGGIQFTTQYILSESTESNGFGVIHSGNQNSAKITTRSTFEFAGSDRYLSGIIPVGSSDVDVNTRSFNAGDVFTIIPAGGRGSIRLVFTDSSQSVFDVAPGSMLTVKLSASSIVEYLSGGVFTTERTILSFPAGSVVSLAKVGVDGTLTVDETIETKLAFTVGADSGSLVGKVTFLSSGQIDTSNGRVTLQKIFSSTSNSVTYLGLVHLKTGSVFSSAVFRFF